MKPVYDPKSIPILDDIIEDDQSDPEQINSDIAENDSEQDDNLDLFTTADIAISDINVEIAEAEIAAIDQFLDTAEESTEKTDTDTIESTLIDYRSEEFDAAAVNLQHDETYREETLLEEIQQYDTQTTSDSTIINITADNMPAESVLPITLDSIVDDVVKQLMPDLEQQLRLLVQQALEEKLPAEIIEQFSADKND